MRKEKKKEKEANMKFLEELGLAMVVCKVSSFFDDAHDLKKAQVEKTRMENELLKLKMQIATMEVQKDILYQPDESDIEIMRNFATIRMAISKKD